MSATSDHGVGITVPDDPSQAYDLKLMCRLDERMRSHQIADIEQRDTLAPKLRALAAMIADVQGCADRLRRDEDSKWNTLLDREAGKLGIGDDETEFTEPDSTTCEVFDGLDAIADPQSSVEEIQAYCQSLASIFTATPTNH